MPIGEFARRTGLTSSALRFYADSGVLTPADVDPATGYRSYAEQQVVRATTLRQLRDMGMPLGHAGQVLDADDVEAARLIDEHVTTIVAEARRAQRTAAALTSTLATTLTSTLATGDGQPLGTVSGPVLAAALDQVLSASSSDPDLPVLNSVHVEVEGTAMTLTATDRFRLATRSLVRAEPATASWSGIVHADDLRLAAPVIRRSPTVLLARGDEELHLRVVGGDHRRCRLVPGEYPDHRHLLESLPDVVTRVVVSRDLLERSLEMAAVARIGIDVAGGSIAIQPDGDEQAVQELPAVVTGEDLEIWFDTTTLHPAVAVAVGPDVMIDVRGPAQPATVRSADRGDLTTLVMPVHRSTEGTS